MIGIYLSGTGNTKHCMEEFCKRLDSNAKLIPIEDPSAAIEIKAADKIVLGYPTQFSNAPFMVRDFIQKHAKIWEGKQVFCLVTMGAFSGDGSGCTARLLKKAGAVILGGLHLKMPDSVCDSKLLKKSLEQNQQIIEAADCKIKSAVKQIRNGMYPQEGLSVFAHIVGLFGQRLWYYKKTQAYSNQLKISQECIGCGLCTKICPMHNLHLKAGKSMPVGKCTMCYRCISRCPKQAITLLGDKVQEQCRFEKYKK